MENEQVKSTGLRYFIEESILFKLGTIGFLTIILLIPSSWIQTLITERQNRQAEVIQEVSEKWSGSQLVQGPVLVLPYRTQVATKDKDGKTSYEQVLSNIYILPEQLAIESTVNPEVLHRGIFDAVVYNARVKVKGAFSELELKKSGINPDAILWNKAKVDIGLSDLKGLKNNPVIQLGNERHEVEPDFNALKLFKNNLVILPDLSANRKTALPFSFELDMRGSTALHFLHLGKTTTVKIEGKWNSPSFSGRYLPESREISKDGFKATWKIPFFNRSYPQQWIDENTVLDTENISTAVPEPARADQHIQQSNDKYFGVDFKSGVDDYQKTMRSAKYSVLIILLTFISLFFTELLRKKKVHLLQYVLIGVAMTIYYTLLLAFTEHIGFNLAYLISSVATVVLISVFIGTLLRNRKPALLFGSILTVFYGFIFVIIQLQDMALIFGSIGLFITVAVLMYLSTRLDWSEQK